MNKIYSVCTHLLRNGHMTNMTKNKEIDTLHDPTLIYFEHHARSDSYDNHMYDTVILILTLVSRIPTPEALQEWNNKYPRSDSTNLLCNIGPAFAELLEYNVTTEVEQDDNKYDVGSTMEKNNSDSVDSE